MNGPLLQDTGLTIGALWVLLIVAVAAGTMFKMIVNEHGATAPYNRRMISFVISFLLAAGKPLANLGLAPIAHVYSANTGPAVMVFGLFLVTTELWLLYRGSRTVVLSRQHSKLGCGFCQLSLWGIFACTTGSALFVCSYLAQDRGKPFTSPNGMMIFGWVPIWLQVIAVPVAAIFWWLTVQSDDAPHKEEF